MSFKKMVAAAFCGMLIFDAVAAGLKAFDGALKKRHGRRMQDDADCEGYESIYSGKKSEGPCARKIGFGAND